MRTLFVTGPGGSGRTTLAAATALAAARRGSRTLVLSADPVDSLGTALGIRTGAVATEAEANLSALRADPAEDFRRELLALQDRFTGALDLLGAGRLEAEELLPLPGARELSLLRALHTAAVGPRPRGGAPAGMAPGGTAPTGTAPAEAGTPGEGAGPVSESVTGSALPYDLLVVDLPPVTEAIGLLALPGQLRRYLARLLPPERQAARALRPVLGRLAGVPVPTEALYEAAARWDAELAAVQGLVESADSRVLLVAEPGPAGAEAVRTALTGLALHRLDLAGLAANRVLPENAEGHWAQELAAQQRKTLAEWRGGGLRAARVEVGAAGTGAGSADAGLGAASAEAGPASADAGAGAGSAAPGAGTRSAGAGAAQVPLSEVPHLGRDPQGTDDLAALGQVPPAGGGPVPEWPVVDRLAADGLLLWRIPLPGAAREELDLVRRGAELVLTAGPFRRIVPLPSALRRCRVAGAALRDSVLELRFAPDPALWPQEQ
ncbi:ArsA family ATPase [Streptomyces physcomitrii]|uniref:ArsA family ATPase n=1 Tax=Streptomyces physcomitrii TaxID=2724184 RepID=A0ABX1H2H2_9ACTN|nr:ArsA-related P-loop ATPase [Streptomyces physcomitrii]NKI41449.1 ArsA family ATPase [Streptomyces physcomitrii]